MKKVVFIILFSTIIGACKEEPKEEPVVLSSIKQKASYAIGVAIAKDIKNRELDLPVMMKAFEDEINNREILINPDSAYTYIEAYNKQLMKKLRKNEIAGNRYLEENSKNEDIITTESGLQYEIIEEGEGAPPTDTDVVTINYIGKLRNGKVFDSSKKVNEGESEFLDFIVSHIEMKGLQEGIKLMNKGAKYRFYIPAELAGYIMESNALIYDVDLRDIKPLEEDQNINNTEKK